MLLSCQVRLSNLLINFYNIRMNISCHSGGQITSSELLRNIWALGIVGKYYNILYFILLGRRRILHRKWKEAMARIERQGAAKRGERTACCILT